MARRALPLKPRQRPHRGQPRARAAGASWLRPAAAGLVALGLLMWGAAERHESLSYIGVALLSCWLLAAWSAYAAPLRHIRVEVSVSSEQVGPVATELAWTTTLTSRSELPRLWLRITDTWQRIDDEGNILAEHTCSRLLYPRYSRQNNSLSYKMKLPEATTGVYRYKCTELATGDIFGWWKRKHSFVPDTGPASGEVIVVPSASSWSADTSMKELFTRSGGTGADRMSETRDNLSSSAGGDVPSIELRPYQLSDAWRSIHWRVYAKSRRLAVRPYQESAGKTLLLVLDDRNETGVKLDKHAMSVLIDTALEWVCHAHTHIHVYGGQLVMLRLSNGAWTKGSSAMLHQLAADRRLAIDERDSRDNALHFSEEQEIIPSNSSITVISPHEASSHAASIQFRYPMLRIRSWIQSIPVSALAHDTARNEYGRNECTEALREERNEPHLADNPGTAENLTAGELV